MAFSRRMVASGLTPGAGVTGRGSNAAGDGYRVDSDELEAAAVLADRHQRVA